MKGGQSLKRKHTIDLDFLTNKLEEIKVVKDNGVSFGGFPFDDIASVIKFEFQSAKISEIDENRIVSEAILAVARKERITKKSLSGEVHRKEAEFLAKIPQKYILATTLTCQYFKEIRTVRLANVSLTFNHKLPINFTKHQDNDKLLEFVPELTPKFSTATKISLKARSEYEAIERALEAVDFLRGIWNYILNRQIYKKISFGNRKPINNIRLGPVHTLHHPNGNLASSQFWYEPDYYKDTGRPFKRIDWNWLKKEEKYIREVINLSSYGTDLSKAFVRYTKAMDTNDYDATFLKLWALLEFLTDTDGSNYEKTIQRTVFIFAQKDKYRELNKQILQHLRLHRNRAIHTSHSPDDIVSYSFQLKRFVEYLLTFHIHHERKFASIEEAGNFLDLSQEVGELQTKINLLNFAVRYRGVKSI